MPKETRTLPDISKTALKLQLERNVESFNRVALQALGREGLLDGGWYINDKLDAERDVPEPEAPSEA